MKEAGRRNEKQPRGQGSDQKWELMSVPRCGLGDPTGETEAQEGKCASAKSSPVKERAQGNIAPGSARGAKKIWRDGPALSANQAGGKGERAGRVASVWEGSTMRPGDKAENECNVGRDVSVRSGLGASTGATGRGCSTTSSGRDEESYVARPNKRRGAE